MATASRVFINSAAALFLTVFLLAPGYCLASAVVAVTPVRNITLPAGTSNIIDIVVEPRSSPSAAAPPPPSSIYEYLQQNPKSFSEFLKSAERSTAISGILKDASFPLTVFVPTNAAVQRWRRRNQYDEAVLVPTSILNNHLTFVSYKYDKLLDIATASRLDQRFLKTFYNYILWLTYYENGNVLFVNNARVLFDSNNSNNNNETTTFTIKQQVLYTVDDVFEPVVSISNNGSSSSSTAEVPGTAEKFMLQASKYNRVLEYIRQFNLDTVFGNNNNITTAAAPLYTFFLPDDEAFASSVTDPQQQQVTRLAILTHVVKNRVLFVNQIAYEQQQQQQQYHSKNGSEFGYVPLSFEQQNSSNNTSRPSGGMQVLLSITSPPSPFGPQQLPQQLPPTGAADYYADANFPFAYSVVNFDTAAGGQQQNNNSVAIEGGTVLFPGRVYARITRANIPIENGVVHLIDKPFLLVHENVADTIANPKLLGSVWEDFAQKPEATELKSVLSQEDAVTFFAPTSAAVAGLPQAKREELLDKTADIFGLHTLRERLMLSDITNTTVRQLPNGKTLTFKIVNDYSVNGLPQPMYYVVGGGVSARIIQPDVAAKNGIVHVIDQVLGLPSPSIVDVIQNDTAQLSTTYDYLVQTAMIYKIQQLQQNFTVFAPSNRAWAALDFGVRQRLSHDLPSLLRILERHVVPSRVENPFAGSDAADAKQQQQRQSQQAFSFNGVLTVNYNANGLMSNVQWMDVNAGIVDAELFGDNGVVHIIDRVFINDSDTSQLQPATQLNGAASDKLNGRTNAAAATTPRSMLYFSVLAAAASMILMLC